MLAHAVLKGPATIFANTNHLTGKCMRPEQDRLTRELLHRLMLGIHAQAEEEAEPLESADESV